ncbi:hypothetical protein OKW46_006164 [Paraburkholderia sp. WSM4179]|nr:hypothetical protein [Paraburkholderia sp. WSM4179]
MGETRKRELGLRAAFVAEQFMPFVDDHNPNLSQYFARVGARQNQRQTLGRLVGMGRLGHRKRSHRVWRIRLPATRAGCTCGPRGRATVQRGS